MKIPGPNSYAREWIIKDEHWRLKFCKRIEKDVVGLCDPSDKTISIKRGQDKIEILKTAIHEKIHAFEEEYNFKLSHKHVYKLEEAIVDFILNNFVNLEKLFKE